MGKSAKRVPINNLYYFSAKTKKHELTFDQLIKAAKHITRANDRTKTIGNKQAKFLTATLYDLIKKSEHGVIYITHDYISEITDCSPRQNANILRQLADIFEFTYHRYVASVKRSYCYETKLTTDGEKRLSNPELFYNVNAPKKSEKNNSTSGKKLPVIEKKITASYISNNDIEYEEDRAIYSSKSSSLPTVEYDCRVVTHAREEKSQSAEIVQITNTKPEPAPQEPIIEVPTLATGYPTEPAKVYQTEEIRSEATEADTTSNRLAELTVIQDIPILANLLTNTESIFSEEGGVDTGRTDQITQLKAEIFKAFDSKTSEEIMENCTFTELEPNKLGISIKAHFSLNIGDKEKLKTTIRAVYGGDVKMVNTLSQNKQEITSAKTQETPIRQTKTEWDGMKHQIAEYFPENQYNHVKNTWLEHLRYSYASQDQIVVIGRGFYVDYITDKFATAIEFAVKQTKKSLIFQYEGNAQRPIEFKFKR